MRVTLAIPNYNGLTYLRKLMPRVLEENFDSIFVLDDYSQDNSVEFLSKNFPSVKVARGRKNLGPTANRNRIMQRDFGDILVFLDVDMELLTKGVVSKIKALFKKYPKTAVFGGLILSKTGKPMWFNRGYDHHPLRGAKSEVWHAFATAFLDNPKVMEYVKKGARGLTFDFEEPKDGKVDWVAEGLFMVRSKVFRSLGGFDEKFRMFQEGPDFCRRARNAGFDVRFTTKIKVKHLEAKSVPESKRKKYFLDSMIYWYRKHYGVPKDLTKKFLP